MDTKLKKSKYHPLIKLVAVLLTITFAFLTGVNALSYLRKAVFYADIGNDITSTLAFKNELTHTISTIYSLKEATEIYEEDLSEKEYLKTNKAKKIIEEYNQKEERAVKLFNVIQELKKLRPDIIETKNGIYEIEENGYVYFDEIEDYVDATVFYPIYGVHTLLFPGNLNRLLPLSGPGRDASYPYPDHVSFVPFHDGGL